VSVDASGNIFVADYLNNAVKEIVAFSGVVSASSTVNTAARDTFGRSPHFALQVSFS
jgi:hypothetical protein